MGTRLGRHGPKWERNHPCPQLVAICTSQVWGSESLNETSFARNTDPILSSPKPGFRSGPHRFSHMERLRRSESWRSESRSPVSAECIANMYLPARNICAGTGLTPATSAPGLGSPPPHLRRDLAHPRHICAGTGLTLPTSAPRLRSSPPHLRRDCAHRCHVCTRAGPPAIRPQTPPPPPASASGANGKSKSKRENKHGGAS